VHKNNVCVFLSYLGTGVCLDISFAVKISRAPLVLESQMMLLEWTWYAVFVLKQLLDTISTRSATDKRITLGTETFSSTT